MKAPSRTFFVLVIASLVVFAGTQQYIIHGYEGVTDQLLATVDQLFHALSIQMNRMR